MISSAPTVAGTWYGMRGFLLETSALTPDGVVTINGCTVDDPPLSSKLLPIYSMKSSVSSLPCASRRKS